jgi:hypothetical protein
MVVEEARNDSSSRSAPDERVACVTVSGCSALAQRWPQFLHDHDQWRRDRTAEARVVYAFPLRVADHRLAVLFGIDEPTTKAEQAYAAICAAGRAVAIHRDRQIWYRWLEPTIAAPATDKMKRLGWTDEHIQQARSLIDKANGIAERLQGSIGRLVCSPSFCAARDALRIQWGSLSPSEQPAFPLHRSLKVLDPADTLDIAPASTQQDEFARTFDEFCDSWRICGMATWELPDVDGPKWSEPELGADSGLLGRSTYDTPWHFCLRAEDDLGNLLRQQHEQVAQEMAVNDHNSWRTYGQLFLLDFWEQVIRSRYLDVPRPRGFVTALTSFIADIVGLDGERVAKLRKLRSALQKGTLTSLAGRR